MMWQILAQFAIISVLFQSIQGNFDYLETKRNSKIFNNINGFRDHTNAFLNIHNRAATDPNLPRGRRQSGGNNPSAYSVTFLGDDSDFIRTVYSGEGSAVVYVLTYDVLKVQSRDYVISSRLYRSTNYGRTFSGQSSKFPQGFLLDSTVYKFPNSRAVIFTDAIRPTIYVSTNEGSTFSAYNVTVNPRTMKVHPTTTGWLLGHDPSQGAIMYSKNYGASWAIVARNVHPSDYTGYSIADFIWGRPGIDWDVNNPSQSDITKVFYTVYDSSAPSLYNDRILYTANNPGSGYVNRVFDSNLGYFFYFQVDGDYIYAEQVISDDFELELYVSHMRNSFNLVRIPSSSSHYAYIYGSHRSSQSLVIIRHDSGYNLYLSDATGTYYTLSLEDLVGENFRVDLSIINSINGTMIANQMITVSSVRRQQTVITFDNGATWQKIAAPVNINGAATNCVLPTCSLHFHMDTSTTYGHIDVYSTRSAPGIIVGHGNLGSYLTDTVSAYITRDGGLTWEQTLDSSWHIEIIDHGGLLVAAREYRRSDYYSRTIKYSCNEGISWNDFDFSSTSLVVWGTNTEPGETTTRVLLVGTRTTSTSYNWVTVYIDFTSVFTRTCQSSDYYYWTVSNGRTGNQQCLLGETRIIERRQANVCCWNGRQYERLISTTPCQCTAADFECEWRYYRDNSGNCIWNSAYGQETECSTGYRKIPGDACFGGVSNQYLIPNCGETTTSSTSSTGASTTGNPTGGGDNGGNSGSQGSDDGSDSGSDNSSSTTIIAVIVVVVILVGVAAVVTGIVIYRVKQHKTTIQYHPSADTKPINVVVNTGNMNGNNIAR